MNLSNKIFRLVDNQDGLAMSDTKMTFSENSAPFIAKYSGDNIVYGNVIVTTSNGEMKMLYHSLSTNNELAAGKANVHLSVNKFNNLDMTLEWCWLTGDLTSGISKWIEVDK